MADRFKAATVLPRRSYARHWLVKEYFNVQHLVECYHLIRIIYIPQEYCAVIVVTDILYATCNNQKYPLLIPS